jgi:hypothetical protein
MARAAKEAVTREMESASACLGTVDRHASSVFVLGRERKRALAMVLAVRRVSVVVVVFFLNVL